MTQTHKSELEELLLGENYHEYESSDDIRAKPEKKNSGITILPFDERITFANFGNEAVQLLVLAAPMSATKVLVAVSRVAGLLFIGRLTSAESLAAATLAGSVSNVTGFSVVSSHKSGLFSNILSVLLRI